MWAITVPDGRSTVIHSMAPLALPVIKVWQTLRPSWLWLVPTVAVFIATRVCLDKRWFRGHAIVVGGVGAVWHGDSQIFYSKPDHGIFLS